MGTFVFKWPHPDAKDVHVTGTFDDWGKSEQLNKVGETWEKEVTLPSADEKILYKFVVDDQWVTDHTAPQENDGHFNVNNVLYPADIKKKTTSSGAGAATGVAAGGAAAGVVGGAAALGAIPTTSSAAPGSTTAELASKAPMEESKSAVPGAFPETPSNEPENFGVKPIPASTGASNPINLKPGEPVPPHSEVTPHTVDSTVTTSKEDYEKAGSTALPIVGGALAGAGVGGAAVSAFSKGEEKKNLIPESSLPMGASPADAADIGPTMTSAAPSSTAAGLAAGVPLEKKRQAMVIDPEDAPKTGLSAVESSASPEVLKEKSAVEKELLSKTTPSEDLGESAKAAAGQTSYYGLATTVPKTVEESMAKAHASPEAATETSVVAEKSALEKELLQKVPSTEEAGEPAPTIAAATSETAPSSGAGIGGSIGAVAGGAAAAVGAAVAGTAAAVKGFGSADKSVPGTSSTAAAQLADGADSTSTPLEVPKTSAAAEKTEADGTEYAPPHTSSTAPGVSGSAAAAVSDGTEHRALAEEPAVKMMNQNEAGSTEPKAADIAPIVAAEAPKAATEPSQAAAPTASDTPASPSSTSTKKPDQLPSDSPATSSTKEKKKKHRISSLFKKIFD